MDKLKEKWFSGDAEKMHIDMKEYTGYDAPNGTIRFIHDSTQVPMTLVRNASTDIYYGYHPDDELKNEIKLTVI